ncbi:MAG: penicillin-binding protein [Patescibacteria group bacterium]
MPIPNLSQSRHYGHVNEPNGGRRQSKKRQILKLAAAIAASLLVLGFIAGTAVVAWVSRDLPDPDKINSRQISQSTKIYDRKGEILLYEIYQNQKRTLVELDQITNYAKKATIAIEDKHFYEHKGVRVISILRAGFNNLIGRRTGSGGASTLTQQLIKNTIVGDERTLFRKIKEAILALRLEKKYSKDQILKLYLNEIPYGSTNYGIESASQSYFHKSAKDLDLAESATLAAIPKAPSRYINNPKALQARRDTILNLMFEQGYIKEEEKKEAQESPLKIFKSSGPMEAPHFVLFVKQLLADQFGEKTVDEGGLRVITSLDYKKQKIAEKAIKELGDKNAKDSNANNASLVAMDPKTGQVLAMVGSRDYNNEEIDGNFNVAVLGKRQPGSSFKPFVYTAAFENGYTPDTILYDVSTNFERQISGNYTPKNFDGKTRGLVTMRKALQGSLNIPAVKTLYLVGINNAIKFAERFGYTTLNANAGLSLVLGGSEVTLFEHTTAYAALANKGIYNAPISIIKITDSSGQILYEWKPMPGQEAIRPELAATISDVLSDNPSRAYIFGAQNTLILPGREVAAKTGTTNDNKDAWTMGYVPSLVAGVWVGNTAPSPMKAGGNRLAGTIWNQFMREALKDVKPEYFPAPPANDAEKPALRGGSGGITLQINSANEKIASSSTPESLRITKTYLPPHDILHYVIKDDPRGPMPSNPSDDPQYRNWEVALEAWILLEQAAGRSYTLEEPPTEYDSAMANELAPTINIVWPTEGLSVDNRNMNFQINATAPRGVAKVSYFIDGQKIGDTTQFPFNFSYYAQKLMKGPHTLAVLAQDDQLNSAEKSVVFGMQADYDPPTFEWFDQTPFTLQEADFPRTFYLNPFRWDDIQDIKVYLYPAGGSVKLIYTFNHAEDKLFNNQLLFSWQHSPGLGDHDLKAIMTDKAGRTVEGTLHVVVE